MGPIQGTRFGLPRTVLRVAGIPLNPDRMSSDLSLYLSLLAIFTACLIGWIVAFRTEAALRRERARAEMLRQRLEEVMHTLDMERRARATEEARGLFGRGGAR